jgi:hypothetical protein
MPKVLHDSGRRDRRIKNRGTKRDVEKANMYMHDYTQLNDHQSILSLAFDTAWSPPIELFEYLAKNNKKLKISIEYSEPWCQFSGLMDFVDWKIESQSEFGDAYYGNGQECPNCHAIYDPEDEVMRDHEFPKLCVDCAEDHRESLINNT